MNNLKYLVTTIVAFLLTTTAMAQQTYADAVRSYFKSNPSGQTITPESMRKALLPINDLRVADYRGMTSDQLVEKYLNEQYQDDMVNAMIPFLMEYVSADELRQLAEMNNSERGKSFQRHVVEMDNALLPKEEELFESKAQLIASGITPLDLEAPQVSEQFLKAFNMFYQASPYNGVLDALTKSYEPLMTNEKSKAFITKYMDYLKRNLPTMYLRGTSQYLTVDDLLYGYEIFSSAAHKKLVTAQKMMLENSQTLGIKLVKAYEEWLKKQPVELK